MVGTHPKPPKPKKEEPEKGKSKAATEVSEEEAREAEAKAERKQAIQEAKQNLAELRKQRASKEMLQVAEIEYIQAQLSDSVQEEGYCSTNTIRLTQQLCKLTVGNVPIVDKMSALINQFDVMSRLFLKAPIDDIINNSEIRGEKVAKLGDNLAKGAGNSVAMAGKFGDFASTMAGRLVLGINGLINEKGNGPLESIGKGLCRAFSDIEKRADLQDKVQGAAEGILSHVKQAVEMTSDAKYVDDSKAKATGKGGGRGGGGGKT